MAAKLWLDYFLKQDCSAWPRFKDSLNLSQRFINDVLVSDIANPVINANGTLLTCTTTAASYQWYLNNNPIPGAVTNTYNAASNGNYYCEVTYAYTNCPYNSGIETITATGIQAVLSQSSFAVFPNPAGNQLNISYVSEANGALSFELYDVTGRLVLRTTDNSPAATAVKKELNMELLSGGTYILYICRDHSRLAYKIMKQ